jgi:hypothetical protein
MARQNNLNIPDKPAVIDGSNMYANRSDDVNANQSGATPELGSNLSSEQRRQNIQTRNENIYLV